VTTTWQILLMMSNERGCYAICRWPSSVVCESAQGFLQENATFGRSLRCFPGGSLFEETFGSK